MAEDFTRNSCREFVSTLASDAPVPGGGGAAALVGAVGTALGNMVGSLTVGKKRYADVESELRELMAQCRAIEDALLDQVRADAEGFEPLARAYGIPKDDPDRERILEEATLEACRAPLAIMELCCRAVDAVEVFAEKGSRIAVSDAGCAAACLKAALQSASLNVFINTKSLKDRTQAEALNRKVGTMLETSAARADAVFARVFAALQPE